MGRKVWVPVVSGPLAPYAAGFGSWLASRAYSRSAAADRLYQFDQLSRWLEREGLGVGRADRRAGRAVRRWSVARRAWCRGRHRRAWRCRWSICGSWGSCRHRCRLLARGPLEELLADYGRYLSVERGLSEHTVLDAYVPAARLFLAGRDGSDGLDLARLAAADVSSFLARECPRRSVSGARDLVCALRSLLRYLHLAGLITTPLVWAVPSVADLRDRTPAAWSGTGRGAQAAGLL